MSTRNAIKTLNACLPDKGSYVTYSAVVRAYNEKHRERAIAEIKYFARQKTLIDAIQSAASAMVDDQKHDHQWRIPNSVLKRFSTTLLLRKERIRKAKNFHDLWLIVREAGSPIKGIGELTIYDTAHRIGVYRNLEPEVVYLHAGTRAGARALGMEASGSSLDMGKLPAAFRRLRPYQVEDCLCIYKTDIAAIQRNSRSK